MKKKIAIVTGAGGNLGRAVVGKLMKENFHVIGIVRKSSRQNSPENNYEEIVLDLLDEKSAENTIQQIVEKPRAVDVAVLTAGGFVMGNIASTAVEDIRKQIQLNFETAYNIARPVFLQMMKQDNGRIFLIGSKPGLDTSKAKAVTAYGLSKSMIFDLAKIMNAEADGKNVVTCVIVPGTIDTPQNRQAMPDADFTNWVLPAQIADVIYFYTTKEATAIREPLIKIYNES